MWVTVIPFAVVALGMVPKGLERKLEELKNGGRIETIQTTATVIPIVVVAFGMVPKGLERKLEELKSGGRIKTIQTTVLLKSTRILRRVLET